MPGIVFKVLVAAIILAALIAIFYQSFAYLFYPVKDLQAEIEKGFELAKANEGKIVESELFVAKAVQVLNTKNFEDSSTLAVFECTDFELCCKDTEECSLGLSFNTERKTLSVEKDSAVSPYYRCLYDRRLFVCKAFFGIKPAQAEISSVKAEKTLKLEQSSQLLIEFKYSNIGELDAFEELTARVQVFDKEDNNPLKQALFETEKAIPKIKAGEEKSSSIIAEFSRAGSFDVKLEIASEEAGKDSKTFAVKAEGIPQNLCTALQKESPQLYPSLGGIEELRGECVSKALCSNCSFAFECKEAWSAKGENSAAADKEYAYVIEPAGACSQ